MTTDPGTWSDLRWLMLNSAFGFVAATVALTATVEVISLITTPLWWWALNDPHHQYATLNLGIYTVTSTGWALITTGLGLALAPVAIAINRGIAVAHAKLARRLLDDPSAGSRLGLTSRIRAAVRPIQSPMRWSGAEAATARLQAGDAAEHGRYPDARGRDCPP